MTDAKREHPSIQSKGGGDDSSRSERAMALEEALKEVKQLLVAHTWVYSSAAKACRVIDAALSPASEGGTSGAGAPPLLSITDRNTRQAMALEVRVQELEAVLRFVQPCLPVLTNMLKHEGFDGGVAQAMKMRAEIERALSPKEPTDG